MISILAMVGEFVSISGDISIGGGGIYDFERGDGCGGKMIVVPKFRRANLV